MPYISTEAVATMRKAIRCALPDYIISVRKHHHSTVDIRVMSGPIVGVDNVNVYWYKEHLKERPDAVRVISTIVDEIFKVEAPKTLVEDSDYGTVPTFYYDVSFGAWDKLYVCTDADAQDRLDIQQAFNEIRKEEKYQTWAASRTCGIGTLAPDDLVVPCVLPLGHTGFCATGR